MSVQIGTHDGGFHCDEVLACSMLRCLPEYKDSKIIRSRDPKVLEGCDILVDVGGIYDHTSRRYDHHQRGFDLTLSDVRSDCYQQIKLSSAGLIYAHYGERVLSSLLEQTFDLNDLRLLYTKVYDSLICEVDAIDNGVPICDTEPRYVINTSLSSRVSRINPHWNESDKNENDCFVRALELVDSELRSIVTNLAHVWLPARSIVASAFAARFSVHSSGHIIELPLGGVCPWKVHLFAIEEDIKHINCQFSDVTNPTASDPRKLLSDEKKSVFGLPLGLPLFVLYCRKDGHWTAQTVPISEKNPFGSRLPFPLAWRGLRDAELSAVTGLPGSVFVHSNGFIAIHAGREETLQMIIKTLSQQISSTTQE